jgi:hypothetical protein
VFGLLQVKQIGGFEHERNISSKFQVPSSNSSISRIPGELLSRQF